MLAAWPSFIAAPFNSPKRGHQLLRRWPRERPVGSAPASRSRPRATASEPSAAPSPASRVKRLKREDGGPPLGRWAMTSGHSNRATLPCAWASHAAVLVSAVLSPWPSMASGDAAGPSSWGRYPPVAQRAVALAWTQRPASRQARTPLLPYGMGRSYGDVCLNPAGPVLLTRELRRFLSFDPESGVLRCEAGCTLGEVAELDASPRLVSAGGPRHAASSPSAARSPTTSTARTTTAPARLAATCARSSSCAATGRGRCAGRRRAGSSSPPRSAASASPASSPGWSCSSPGSRGRGWRSRQCPSRTWTGSPSSPPIRTGRTPTRWPGWTGWHAARRTAAASSSAETTPRGRGRCRRRARAGLSPSTHRTRSSRRPLMRVFNASTAAGRDAGHAASRCGSSSTRSTPSAPGTGSTARAACSSTRAWCRARRRCTSCSPPRPRAGRVPSSPC